ncbi:MAG: hypothetical protein Q7T55_22370, partial [Solirubrobacteraceae bacterium]|nr:hypothetical protein [Solirubrobacteraceae bacterium]
SDEDDHPRVRRQRATEHGYLPNVKKCEGEVLTSPPCDGDNEFCKTEHKTPTASRCPTPPRERRSDEGRSDEGRKSDEETQLGEVVPPPAPKGHVVSSKTSKNQTASRRPAPKVGPEEKEKVKEKEKETEKRAEEDVDGENFAGKRKTKRAVEEKAPGSRARRKEFKPTRPTATKKRAEDEEDGEEERAGEEEDEEKKERADEADEPTPPAVVETDRSGLPLRGRPRDHLPATAADADADAAAPVPVSPLFSLCSSSQSK